MLQFHSVVLEFSLTKISLQSIKKKKKTIENSMQISVVRQHVQDMVRASESNVILALEPDP